MRNEYYALLYCFTFACTALFPFPQLLELNPPKGIELVLEGGYNLAAIEQSYAACVSVLLGDPPIESRPIESPRFPSIAALQVIAQVRRLCAQHAARCTLHIACCTLHAAHCMLHIACCTLHAARCGTASRC